MWSNIFLRRMSFFKTLFVFFSYLPRSHSFLSADSLFLSVPTYLRTYLRTTNESFAPLLIPISVTRLGDFLEFGQLFKAFGNNLFAKSLTFLGNFCKVVKNYYFFEWNHFGAAFRDIWRFFSGHTATYVRTTNESFAPLLIPILVKIFGKQDY